MHVFARRKEDTCMNMDMSNNERMLCSEGLVDAFELGDADLAQVQGARGSNHAESFHRHPWGYSPNYWNNPAYWGYSPNYWNDPAYWGYSQPYPWFHRDYDRWDRR